MKKIVSILIALLSMAPVLHADNGTGFVGNGYYRVKNYGSERYIYVKDNTGSYSMSDVGDFGALELWKDASKTISDPGSVIYIDQINKTDYDLMSQGTGIYRLVGMYVHVNKLTNGTYEVYGQHSSATRYLSDTQTRNTAKGKMGTSTLVADYKQWVVDQIETDDAENYFGITPTISVNGKYYQPFYAEFPFKTASTGMHVYYINIVDEQYAVLKEVTGIVPANSPVIIECISQNPSDNRLELIAPFDGSVTGNMLSGTYFANEGRPNSTDAYVKYDSKSMRTLGVTSQGKLGFITSSDKTLTILHIDPDYYDDPNYWISAIPANQSYMVLPAGNTNTELTILTEEEYKGMGIGDIYATSKTIPQGVYSLSGACMRQTDDTEGLPAGLYIVNGRKVVVK